MANFILQFHLFNATEQETAIPLAVLSVPTQSCAVFWCPTKTRSL